MILKNSIENEEKMQIASRKNLEFLATVSHEIRNPVNAIVGISDLIKKSHSEKEREEYVDRLVETCGNLLSLINNIMDYGKLEFGNVKPNFQPTDLCRAMEQHVSGHKAIAEAKGINFIINIDESLPECVLIDQVKFCQVILNLVSNAAKFTKEGSVIIGINVEAIASSTARLRFYVRDTGIGIPQERLHSIFEAFNQGGEEVNLSYGGTGLGLSISKEIVEMLGGELEVKSREGEGSEFAFTLDLEYISESKGQPILNSKNRGKVHDRNLKLLIVDDNKLNVLVLKKHLEHWGFESKAAYNGLSAVKQIQEEEFDLVLMDFHMPHLDGLSATEAIRNLPKRNLKELPIIGLSASTELFLEEKIKTAGFTDFVSKPFSPAELRDKIHLYTQTLQE